MEHGKPRQELKVQSLPTIKLEGWFRFHLSQVDVQYQRMMKRFVPLSELKKYHLQHQAEGGPLKDMALFTRARLSVQPLTPGKSKEEHVTVTHSAVYFLCRLSDYSQLFCFFSAEEFDFILSLENEEPLWGFGPADAFWQWPHEAPYFTVLYYFFFLLINIKCVFCQIMAHL